MVKTLCPLSRQRPGPSGVTVELRSPAALRRAELGLGGGVVDQRAVAHDGIEDARACGLGPGARLPLTAAKHEVHRQPDRRRAVALREREVGERDIVQPVAPAAVLLGHRGGRVPAAPQLLEVLEREGAVTVVLGSPLREGGRERLCEREQPGLPVVLRPHRRRA